MEFGWRIVACISACAALAACGSATSDWDSPTDATRAEEESTPRPVLACRSLDARLAGRVGWVSAKDAAPFPLEFPRAPVASCLADTGCPNAPTLLPACPDDIEADDVALFAQRAGTRFDSHVVLRGKLLPSVGITVAFCNVGCCNAAAGTLELVGSLRSSAGVPDFFPHVGLGDPERRHAFHCAGDDSLHCSGFETSDLLHETPADVVVAGILRRRPNPSGGFEFYSGPALGYIEKPELCRLPTDACSAAEAPGVAERCEAGDSDPFEVGDLRCACYAGRLACAHDRAACFFDGKWFSETERLPIGRSCQKRECQNGRWLIVGTECAARRARIPP